MSDGYTKTKARPHVAPEYLRKEREEGKKKIKKKNECFAFILISFCHFPPPNQWTIWMNIDYLQLLNISFCSSLTTTSFTALNYHSVLFSPLLVPAFWQGFVLSVTLCDGVGDQIPYLRFDLSTFFGEICQHATERDWTVHPVLDIVYCQNCKPHCHLRTHIKAFKYRNVPESAIRKLIYLMSF